MHVGRGGHDHPWDTHGPMQSIGCTELAQWPSRYRYWRTRAKLLNSARYIRFDPNDPCPTRELFLEDIA